MFFSFYNFPFLHIYNIVHKLKYSNKAFCDFLLNIDINILFWKNVIHNCCNYLCVSSSVRWYLKLSIPLPQSTTINFVKWIRFHTCISIKKKMGIDISNLKNVKTNSENYFKWCLFHINIMGDITITSCSPTIPE